MKILQICSGMSLPCKGILNVVTHFVFKREIEFDSIAKVEICREMHAIANFANIADILQK